MGRRSRIHPGQKLILPAEAASRNMPPAPQPVIQAVAPVAPVAPQPAAMPASRNISNNGGRSIGAEYAALFTHMANRVAVLAGWKTAPQPAPAPSAPAVVAVAAAATPQPLPVSYPVPLPNKDKFRFISSAGDHGVISVLPEETLAHYADWAGVSAREIMRLNKWRRPTLHLWRTVKIPLDKAGAEIFEQRRQNFHHGLYKDFFGSHNVKEVDDRVLLRGQSAWMLCNGRQEVPLWLLSLYNEGKQLNRLHAGEVLRVPVVEKKSS